MTKAEWKKHYRVHRIILRDIVERISAEFAHTLVYGRSEYDPSAFQGIGVAEPRSHDAIRDQGK